MKKWLRYVGILLVAFTVALSAVNVNAGYVEAASTKSSSSAKKTGWVTKKGKKYYYKQGKAVIGWQTIDGKKYYFSKSKKTKGQMLTGLKTVGGKKYYFSKADKTKGQMLTGLQTIGEKKYYFSKSKKTKGQMVTGWQTIDGKKYYFSKSKKAKGQMLTGWRTIDDKKYYFTLSGEKKGQMVTGWLRIGTTYHYFKKNGVYDASKTTDNSRNADSTGTAKEKTYRRAQAIVSMITTPDMTKEEKLRTCFEYVMKYQGRRPRTPHYCGADWPVVYANDMFIDGSGNCFSYAAAFAFMAKACGYKNVYACNSTGHGWTEIDGKIYDPEQYRNTQYKYYGTSYSNVPGYKNAIANMNISGFEFMHVKI